MKEQEVIKLEISYDVLNWLNNCIFLYAADDYIYYFDMIGVLKISKEDVEEKKDSYIVELIKPEDLPQFVKEEYLRTLQQNIAKLIIK